MVKFLFQFTVIFLTAFIIIGCNETTIIGSDLLEDEAVNVKFTDTFSLDAYTIPGESVNANINADTYIAGVLDDPIFGNSVSEIYFAFDRVSAVSTNGATLDSVVVAIEYDTTALYGEWEEALYDIMLYRSSEVLPFLGIDTFQSNRRLSFDPIPLATKSGIKINPVDSILVYDPNQDSVIEQKAHLRLRLEDEAAQEIFDNLMMVESDDDFDALYPSFVMKVIPDRSALLSFDAGNSARNSGINGLKFYYTIDSTGGKREYEYLFDRSITSVRHNVAGAPIEQYLNNPDLGDELVHVQGLAGVRTLVDVSSLYSLQDVLINKVELVFTIAEGDDFFTDIYSPLVSYAAAIEIDGQLVAIEDLGLATGDLFVFNGILMEEELDNGETIQTVTMNITHQVKEFLDDPSLTPQIIITSFTELEDPRRTVFYGPGSTEYPLKLNIAYTDSQ